VIYAKDDISLINIYILKMYKKQKIILGGVLCVVIVKEVDKFIKNNISIIASDKFMSDILKDI
jgi:uncharacterized circularly permuted ATP-grasp superfamily protein